MLLRRPTLLFGAVLLLLIASVISEEVKETKETETKVEDAPLEADDTDIEEDPIVYATPKAPLLSYIAETFDDILSCNKTWITSKAKKDGAEADLAKYDGVWSFEDRDTPLLKGDRALVLKSKAKHAAIAASLTKPFKFGASPLVVQYEVTLQEGQECGGAYLKLLSLVEGKATKMNEFTDKTPYTIMFGPDNCGNNYRVHFIFRHVNPLTGAIEEKHMNKPTTNLEPYFKDKKPHLYTLLLRPDNTFEISIDHISIQTGSILEDMTPPVNPEKEIADQDDFKPEDWDEREKVADPDDTKPLDWDDDAPIKISDESAVKPSGWLDEEPEMIPDPEAAKPDDWDPDMDGEWEAPLLSNPACVGAKGCGPWVQPMVDNPNYRGRWFPKQIPNPDYQGVWAPRMIPNPAYFEDLEPFKMTPIAAVGLELWTMSANVLFDDILITESIDEAIEFAAETFDLKIARLQRGQSNFLQQMVAYSNANPWLYAVYVLAAAIPVIIVVMCCCSPKEKDAEAESKKTDAPTANVEEQESVVEESVVEGAESQGDGESEDERGGSQSEGEDGGDSQDNSQDESVEAEPQVGVSTRARRRVRKD